LPRFKPHHFYLMGGFIGGHRETLYWLHSEFYKMLRWFIKTNRFIGKDQDVFNSLCLIHPTRCHFIRRPDKSNDDKWLYARVVLRRDVPR